MTVAIKALTTLWDRSAERLARRCDDLSDAEYLWAPAPDSWTVKPDAGAPSGWTYDYVFPPPQPAPVTTIAWRLVHIAANNWIYWEYAFGPGAKTFPDLEVPSTAMAALENWRASRVAISGWLLDATDTDLAELRPNHLGGPKPVGDVIGILVDEQIHHGAEIALLRDLYRQR